jgi:hypothetical protein
MRAAALAGLRRPRPAITARRGLEGDGREKEPGGRLEIENANRGDNIVNHEGFRILGLAGSLRQASFHRGILRAAHEVGPEWMSCESFDMGRIPYFNQDIQDEGTPEPVKDLREKIRTHDAVLIATPEYDYAIPGVLTAVLD